MKTAVMKQTPFMSRPIVALPNVVTRRQFLHKALDGALTIGKICTTVLFVCLTILVLIPDLSDAVVNWMTGICSVFLGISFVEYVRAYFGKHKKIHDLET